jgi:hypothetical protein
MLRSRHTLLAAVATLLVAAGGIGPAHASAARSVSGCFGAGNVSVSGLFTQVEYLSVSGRWIPVNGSLAHTDGYGCVRYNIAPRLQGARLTIASAGIVPSWSALVWGQTPLMSRAGTGVAFLGWTSLRWAHLEDQSLTGSWLNSMDQAKPTSLCASSGAAAVACYMDQHNMVANSVVVPKDEDGDHVYDAQDNHPGDPFRH